MKMNKKLMSLVLLAAIGGCSALSGVALDSLTGSDKGIEATAQVGKENQKGLVNTKVDASSSVENDVGVEELNGDLLLDTSTYTNNKTSTMVMLVLSGMLPPLLLLFYMMPSPRWLARRYRGNDEKT